MFWVFDKFGNSLDDPVGSAQFNDPDKLDQPNGPYGPVVPVKFIDSTRPGPPYQLGCQVCLCHWAHSTNLYHWVSLTITTKKIEITDRILPTDILLSVNLNYRQILPTDSQILITDEKIRR